jgi:LEA14-like dessication related protein
MRPIALCLPFLALAACSSTPALQDARAKLDPFMPKVSFRKLEVRRVDFQKADVDFVFNVMNPNPLQVKLSSFRYALSFEGSQVLSGDDPDGMTLSARGTSDLSLPMSLVYAEIFRTVQAVKGKDEVNFTLTGEFGFRTPVGEVKLPYTEKGSFPAPRIPKVTLRRLQVAKPDIKRPTVAAELELAVQNEHGSPIRFRAFRYDITLGGRPASRGEIAALEPVAGASEQILKLPFEINLGGLGSSLVQSLSGRSSNMDLRLSATLEVETPFGVLPLTIEQSQSIALN